MIPNLTRVVGSSKFNHNNIKNPIAVETCTFLKTPISVCKTSTTVQNVTEIGNSAYVRGIQLCPINGVQII